MSHCSFGVGHFVLCLCLLIPYSANDIALNRVAWSCDYHILQAAVLLTVETKLNAFIETND